MRIFSRGFLLVCLVLSSALVAYIAMRGRGGMGQAGNSSQTVARADSYLEGVHMRHMRGGSLEWSIDSSVVNLSLEEGVARMTNVTAISNTLGMRMVSATGNYGLESSDLVLDGPVRADAEDMTIDAGRMVFDAEKREVTSDGPVVVRGDKYRLAGNGLVASQKRVTIKSNVRAEFFD